MTGVLYLGKLSGSVGSFLSSDQSTFSSAFIGYNGHATFAQTGGTVTITNGLNVGLGNGSYGEYGPDSPGGSVNLHAGYIVLGQGTGSEGKFKVFSGNTASITNGLTLGYDGIGTVSHVGGQVTAGTVSLAINPGSQGNYQIKETGSLTTGSLLVGDGRSGLGIQMGMRCSTRG